MESILDSIKKLLGIDPECADFDMDIIININSVFSILTQLGVGPVNGFKIEDNTKTWDQYIGDDMTLEMVKTFTYLKTRLGFDPPQNAFLVNSMTEQIKEYEYRLFTQAELKGGAQPT